MRFTDRNKKMNKEQGEKMLSRLKQKRYNQITIYAAFLVIMIITFVCKKIFMLMRSVVTHYQIIPRVL